MTSRRPSSGSDDVVSFDEEFDDTSRPHQTTNTPPADASIDDSIDESNRTQLSTSGGTEPAWWSHDGRKGSVGSSGSTTIRAADVIKQHKLQLFDHI